MVEIREESSESNTQRTNNNSSNNSRQQSHKNLIEYVKENQTDVLCFVLRLATIYFALGHILPVFSITSKKNSYMKAFLSGAATNAIRLHQRLKNNPQVGFNRMFLSELFFEDSAHYFFYSLIFVMSFPVSMALVPITLYALFHSINFITKLANATGNGNNSLVLKAGQLVSQNTPNILSMIACSEIAVMPIFIGMIFLGKANIFFPFIYYRFISMRYLSRRNPYTRQAFLNLKMFIYRIAGHPSCPQIMRNILYKSVLLTERICPRVY